jgi:hypothetical protein
MATDIKYTETCRKNKYDGIGIKPEKRDMIDGARRNI